MTFDLNSKLTLSGLANQTGSKIQNLINGIFWFDIMLLKNDITPIILNLPSNKNNFLELNVPVNLLLVD